MSSRLDAIKARWSKATPGPWSATYGDELADDVAWLIAELERATALRDTFSERASALFMEAFVVAQWARRWKALAKLYRLGPARSGFDFGVGDE